MNKLLAGTTHGDLVDYKPQRGLKVIAVAEAAEKHFARAKNYDKLYKAVELKLIEQRKFVRWWDGLGEKRGNPTKRNGSVTFPIAGRDGMPGRMVIKRWREITADDKCFARALAEAQTACLRICEQTRNEVKPYTGDDEWYTPAEHIERVRRVLGGIDLDPASNVKAQQIIKAERFFTSANDASNQEWRGRVWLNPPYSKGLLLKLVSKMIHEVKHKHATAAIMLLPNFTDADWFQLACSICDAMCFPRGRIYFEHALGKIDRPLNGQVFFYYGADVDLFCSDFSAVGCGLVGAGSWRWLH